MGVEKLKRLRIAKNDSKKFIIIVKSSQSGQLHNICLSVAISTQPVYNDLSCMRGLLYHLSKKTVFSFKLLPANN